MRLSSSSMKQNIHPLYFYVLSLIIVVALYTKVNVESAMLYIVSAGLSLYILKCHCKAILVSLFVVGLYMMSMNVVIEGMKESALDMKAVIAANSKKSKQKTKGGLTR